MAASEGPKGKEKSLNHAYNYPGRKTPKVEKVREHVEHDHAAHKEGFSNSLGESANGSHKGLRK